MYQYWPVSSLLFINFSHDKSRPHCISLLVPNNGAEAVLLSGASTGRDLKAGQQVAQLAGRGVTADDGDI